MRYETLFVQDGVINDHADTYRDYTTIDVSIFGIREANDIDLAMHHLCCKSSRDIVLFRINKGEWIWC